MIFKRTALPLTISLFLLFAPVFLLAGSQENPLVQAIKFFDQNKFQEAEEILGKLMIEEPDNLMVNYFYGACRTENQHFGKKEISYLLKGSTGESPLKTDYYLGIQFHAQNQWEDALKYYRMFGKDSSEEEAKELGLAEKINQCNNHINPFKTEETADSLDIAPAPVTRPEGTAVSVSGAAVYPGYEESDSIRNDSSVHDSVPLQEKYEEPSLKLPKSEPIEFVVNGDLTYIDTSNFQTSNGLESFLQWKSSRKKLDSLSTQTDRWRKEYAEAKTTAVRNELGQKIMEAETNQFALQKQTRELLTAARQAESVYWNNMPEDEQIAFSNKLKLQAASVVKNTETQEPVDTSLLLVEVFDDITPAATPVAKEEKKDELIYKIQIGAYSRGLPNYVKKQFDKLSYIRKIENYTDDRGVVVYTTGNLTNLEDAIKMQNQVRQEGIEDAFVVPYFNGKRITLKEAKKLEQEK